MSLGTYSSTYLTTITLFGAYNPATVTASGVVNVNTPAAHTPGILGPAGTNWKLTNQGAIQSVGNTGFGVYLNGLGGTVTNSGAIQGTGLPIRINGASGSVVNSGTIAQIGAGGSNGILLAAGGVVSNSGTITSQGINF